MNVFLKHSARHRPKWTLKLPHLPQIKSGRSGQSQNSTVQAERTHIHPLCVRNTCKKPSYLQGSVLLSNSITVIPQLYLNQELHALSLPLTFPCVHCSILITSSFSSLRFLVASCWPNPKPIFQSSLGISVHFQPLDTLSLNWILFETVSLHLAPYTYVHSLKKQFLRAYYVHNSVGKEVEILKYFILLNLYYKGGIEK